MRSLGSGPFSVLTTHSKQRNSFYLRFSIPHVFTTEWKRELRAIITQLTKAREASIGTGDMTATALLGSIDRLLTEDLHMLPENLDMCIVGWNHTDYGELHAGGTGGNRV